MKILACLDLARSSPAVLREARLWARRLSAELYLLHVAEPDPDFIGGGAGPESLRLAVAHKNKLAQQRLEAAAVELRKDNLDATAVLVQGAVADMILQEANRLHADVILMGTYARGVANSPFIGSASKQVLFKAARPVLLIPPNDAPP